MKRREVLLTVAAAEAQVNLVRKALDDTTFVVRDEHGQRPLARDLRETPLPDTCPPPSDDQRPTEAHAGA